MYEAAIGGQKFSFTPLDAGNDEAPDTDSDTDANNTGDAETSAADDASTDSDKDEAEPASN